MRYFLDISLVLIIVFTIISGWKKGLIRSILGVGKTLVAILTSYLFGPPASAWVSAHVITDRVTSFIYDRLLAVLEKGADALDLTTFLENLPNWMNYFFEKTGVDPATLLGDLSGLTEADSVTLQSLSQTLATPISKMISDMIGYTAVFLISMLVFAIVAYLLGKFADLPVIRRIDRTLGLVLGIFCALIYASVYTLLLYAVMTLVEGHYESFAFHAAYEQTWLFKILYDINIFRWIIGIG